MLMLQFEPVFQAHDVGLEPGQDAWMPHTVGDVYNGCDALLLLSLPSCACVSVAQQRRLSE